MIKHIFKICLAVTVASLLITLVLLPFGVRSMVDTANEWAKYNTYETEYEDTLENITQVNVKFSGRNWVACAVKRQNTAGEVGLSTSGLQVYDVVTTSEVEGSVLNLTVDFSVKPEFEQYDALIQSAGLLQTNLAVPLGVEVTFDESSCRVTSYTSQEDMHWVMNGFYDYCQEPLTQYGAIRESLYQYAVGVYSREEYDAAFERTAVDILADVADTVRNSERAAASEAAQWEYTDPEYDRLQEGTAVDSGETVIAEIEPYGSRTLPENTGVLVETYLNAVQEYLAVSVDCWCAMNSSTAPDLKTVDTPLDTLRAQRTAAQQKVTEARRALAEAVDGCVYHEYIYSALMLD